MKSLISLKLLFAFSPFSTNTMAVGTLIRTPKFQFIDGKIDDLTNLTLSINGSVYSYLSEFTLIQELISNQTDMLVIALADISFFDNLNILKISDLYCYFVE